MGNPAAPLEVTIDHHPDPGDAHPVAPRPVLKFVAQAVPGSDTELELLLRKRLRFLALLFGSVFASLAIVLLPMDLFWFLGRQTAAEWGHWVALAMSWSLLLTYGAIAWRLSRGPPLPLSRLRAVEIVLFGLFVLDLIVDRLMRSWLLPGLGHLLHLYEIGTDNVADELLGGLTSGSAVPWVFTIILYGVLIPNTSRRCALVVGALASIGFTLNAVVILGRGFRAEIWLASQLFVTLILAVAAVIAIYGSHRIEVLRRQAAEARRLGQYQLQRRLGGGGMGEVYLAEHLLLRRPCAVKLIRPERAGDPRNLQRFEREVKSTATLTHPNTVQIFDYGHAEDGTFYYVMEYLPGLTLEQLVERYGPLPPARAVHFLRQVCGALREAHAAGLIHRDLKPGNVMVCERGGLHDTAKLLDFGLVLPMDSIAEGEKFTQEGAFAGTPAYVSPEQAGGHDGLDGRSDIYSVGALAYFLLTGRPPFVGLSPVRMLAAHLHERPEPLSRHRPEVPADLEAVVLRCLAKEPGERFPEAESLELALAHCSSAGTWSQQDAARGWRTRSESNETGAGSVDRVRAEHS